LGWASDLCFYLAQYAVANCLKLARFNLPGFMGSEPIEYGVQGTCAR
jgi:hypothetical protein